MKFLKYFLCLAILAALFMIGASAQTPDSLEFPDSNEYWVIYFDEQNGGVMLGTASLADSSSDVNLVLSWGEYGDMLDPVEFENIRFYYLSDDGDSWIALDDYEQPYDFAKRAIASNVPVYSNTGVIYLKATEYGRVKDIVSSTYKSYCERRTVL